jgi:hypothetical protein
LNPGPHGPELCARSSTEAVFEGFGFILGESTEADFGALGAPVLLHELLHLFSSLEARPSQLNGSPSDVASAPAALDFI